ncbi:MAG: 5-(carboxyamino)imidazole ribonucleotide synthase [Hyphomicrobiales bacterium]|nr:5-(carboxyamino)imidazole ribonucleotide synthase [Hyphomicrobiales bacterium]
MLPKGSTIGILGGGQLGWMLSLAAKDLGYHCHIFAPEENPPAMQAAAHHTRSGFDNIDELKTFAKSVNVITYEFENIPVEPLREIENICAIHPSLKSLEICQHRLKEKNFVKDLCISTTPFAEARDVDHLPPIFDIELPTFVKAFQKGRFFKTLRMGYDGKRQFVIRRREDASQVPEKLGKGPWIVEVGLDFFQEFAVVVARDKGGNTRCFDTIATYHEEGILRKAKIPSGLHPKFETYAQEVAVKIVKKLEHVGVLTVEFFLLRNINGAEDNDGTNASKRILVNEIAPRVHNSGHLTRETCATDQFKQHINAICGLDLGDTTRTKDAVMVNLLGDEVKKWEKPSDDPNTNVTIYRKGEARPGRKMGHVVWTQPISR